MSNENGTEWNSFNFRRRNYVQFLFSLSGVLLAGWHLMKFCKFSYVIVKLNAGFLLILLMNPKDGGDMCLWNVGRLSADYTALYPRRQRCS
jgi:hypothetical protein